MNKLINFGIDTTGIFLSNTKEHNFFFYKQLCDTHAGIYGYFYEINTET